MKAETEKSIIAALEFEWSQEGGFFFDYRNGKFNEEGYVRTYDAITRLDFHGEERISKHIVALIYSIPFFLTANIDMVLRSGGSELRCSRAITDFACLVGDKLETI